MRSVKRAVTLYARIISHVAYTYVFERVTSRKKKNRFVSRCEG